MKGQRAAGFALVITLVLLALLVLAVFALSALTKVGGEVALTSTYQTQARQNALLGLNVALGELQRYAANDNCLTGMAGVTGALPQSTLRQWAVVWPSSTSAPVWLASGATVGSGGPIVSGDKITVVGPASVANPVNKTDQEFVEVGLINIPSVDQAGVTVPLGRMGYWVGDEGVKLSAVLGNQDTPVANAKHSLGTLTAISPTALGINTSLTYEQLALVPQGTLTTAVKAGQLRQAFHSMTRTHFGWNGPLLQTGLLNVNSSSTRYWTAVIDTFTRLDPSGAGAISPNAVGAAAASLSGRPFATVQEFFDALTPLSGPLGLSMNALSTTMRPWLCVRSDTFRIRAYGDAVNAIIDPAKPTAVAYCEAIVQRVKDNPSATDGRFVITYFRWLGPDDI